MVGTQTDSGNKMEVQNALPTLTTTTTSVADFYNGKTVFITGGTGFMGKVLLEKLLRSCSGVAAIYLLIRYKKGQNAHDRLQQLLSSPLFDILRKERPGDLSKVLPIEGDITQPNLAISVNDRVMLSRTVNVVFHSAATVKFDEKLKLSVTINMLGTQRLIELCKKMTNLEALIHVSTTYCNCDKTEIYEKIYNPSISPDQITSLVDTLDESLVDAMTPILVGKRPNTYTFTKALAESWLKENKGDLPLVIVRPSIVISSHGGPLKGWVDNWNGPTGIIAAAGKGVFRSMHCHPEKTADLVPVDLVINLMLAAGWKVGSCKTKEIPIYNCCTGQRKPISWRSFVELCFKYMRIYPFSDVTWYPSGTVTSSVALDTFNQYVLHWFPAYVIDAFTWICGGKPIMLKIQDKLQKASTCLDYFTTHEWVFDDTNVRQLGLSLSEADRREFNFDASQIDWDEFIKHYVLGIRRFIFKEDAATIPKARRSIAKLLWVYRITQFITVLTLWHFLTLRCAPLRQLWSNALKLLLHIARMLPIL
ncbi:PREDICTED: putative fatty acyl-CoA reductase CG5065 [Nicrophorus vespilloides]|uniref:Fatty acyl-CoA reductase n=1 Tax=Nicrophorus vespilloides TaxID=110193 RepID=A0ABM1N3H8_NICVS|nr:PREDICTED: putative fatty acyl-CoA reductase CG5065 [Nicrophorus vespilloides]XP_017781378.1 PREDICTED: putative fatty acyl-CoA reductase CG5065 [Nicrophorus vespilloides]